MNKVLKEKIMEAFSSVLPITAIVLIASVVLPMPPGTILMFMGGAALLIIGMGFFSLGVDMAMMPMGEGVGVQLTKSSKLALIIIISFLMGVIITIAEPDLIVLAQQIGDDAIPFWYLIGTVAAGVGFLLMVAVLRTLFKIRLSILLIASYTITFVLCCFVPGSFIPIAFEAGGIATGPILVPFIIAIGLGLASVRSDKNSHDDSFGLVALVLTGPVIAMLLLGIFYKPPAMEVTTTAIQEVTSSQEVVKYFAIQLPHYLKDVFLALGCIMICFIILQIVSRRYHGNQLVRIAIGFLYTLIGLVFFLTGVNVGFIPVGQLLGLQLAASSFKWVLIPFGTLIGYFLVAAEPAVHVLTRQVEDVSSGAITRKMMNRGLAIGMAAALAITMTRILLGISIMWILLPGYALTLALTFFVPRIFTGIAFDAGAVCSGPMSATFLLPLAMGAAEGVGRNLMTYAIGIVAIVAMTPILVVQIMGIVYQIRTKQAAALTEQQAAAISAMAGGEIVDYGEITFFDEDAHG